MNLKLGGAPKFMFVFRFDNSYFQSKDMMFIRGTKCLFRQTRDPANVKAMKKTYALAVLAFLYDSFFKKKKIIKTNVTFRTLCMCNDVILRKQKHR